MIKEKLSYFLKRYNLQTILINLIVLVLYIVSGKLGLLLASVNPSATAIWPPTGIAFASVLLFGYRAFPAIFLGAFFVNITTAGTIPTSLGIAVGNTLEAIIGVYLVKRYAGGITCFDSFLGLVKFILLAGVVSTSVSASIGVASLIAGDLANISDFGPIWLTWWLGDMGGNVLIAPLILVWAVNLKKIQVNLKKILHFLISWAILSIITMNVFSGILPFPYLCIPIAVWIAFWFEKKGATLTSIFVGIIAIAYTFNGQGPFGENYPPHESLLLVQLFLNVLAITTLIIAIAVHKIRESQGVIQSREERFRSLIEKSFDGVVLVDATSKILYASPSVKRLIGYTPEEIVGKVGFSLVAPVDRKRAMLALSQVVLKPGNVLTIEYRSIRKDKKIIWVEATGTNLLFDPNVNAVVINFHDITEKKIYEERLLAEKMEDEAMLASIGEGIIATDNKGAITLLNDAACEMLGWEREDLFGRILTDVIPMEDEGGNIIPESSRHMTKVLSLGKRIITSTTNFYVRKDGTKFPIDLTLTPIVLNGKIIGTIEVFSDITREKEVDKAKSEFVSIASHQLRTPLTIINWYIEELMSKATAPNGKQKEYFQIIQSASHRMVDLINSLLNVSRLELGTFNIEPKNTNLLEIAEQVVSDFQSQIEEKGIDFKKDYQSDLPAIFADPKLITIIIQNLVSNAIKYSPESGKIELKISKDEKGFLICIKDNGIGIPKDQQSKIFYKMFRADNSRNVDPEGTGLGLYIVKVIIEKTGGRVWFESEENKGSAFYVLLQDYKIESKEGKVLLN